MADYKGIEYLRRKLAQKRPRVLRRYKYYDMKYRVRDFGISTPPDLRQWMSTLGWCARGVDALADRLQFYRFGDDVFDLNGIYDMNNRDVLFDSAVLSAMVSSCCFLYISTGENDFPRIQVIDGGNATGVIDDFTGLLTEGYAVLERDDQGTAITEAYFTPEETVYYRGGKVIDGRPNPAPYALLAPVIYRPDAARPFGHSRISRACMDIVGAAVRTVKRSEIAAEFYSYPQKYITGLSEDAEKMDKWQATMAAMLAITKDEDGESPKLGSFTQQSMAPHTEQLRMFAALFAGETGLTLDDLGFPSENPSSSEAIKAAHENLRLTARKAQRTFGSGFLNAGYLAACLRDNFAYRRQQLYLTRPEWLPIFEPDASALSGIGDGIIKMNQTIPEYINEDRMRNLTGII